LQKFLEVGGTEMNAIEAIDTINSWRRILVEGMPAQIDAMLQNVEKTLEQKGWKRRPDLEAKMGRFPDRADRIRCFVGGPLNGPQLALALTRVSERRVRGGTYSLINPSMPIDVADVVEDVIKNVITPSATDLGLRVTVPRIGHLSQVPPKTMDTLYFFSDLAAGMWPLSADMDRAWQRFVATACREGAAFDVDELMEWFVTNGWNSDIAGQLRDRYLSEAALIAEYDEV
jgi:hypothetical protein